MLRKDLIRLNVDAKTSEDALRTMAQVFVDLGIAKSTYPQAIIEREDKYPTALPAAAFDIAIPHTFAEHVNEPAMGICVLKKPVEFKQMGSPDITLYPQILFMLAVTDPKDQISILRKIMMLIQNSDVLKKIKTATTVDEVYSIVNSLIFEK
ncbi:PTS sugar transporter subunit IIA [Clostridium sp. AL.422]|uniref:PTS sugar transporter subunit IIA n=1 Tax=Clostridium TaxID=1485 RepID=UPI00293DC2ED|nr:MULTISPECIES: PTS sugar transporter subunit IIA [unclassified Clostridium]MDV4149949.1 PTS sugar transporter subunit IIA [Clostridium sp. AL.422]